MLLKEYVGSGCSLLKRQQTGQVGGQERLLYFRCQQLGGWGAGCLSKGWLSSLPYKQGVRTLIDGAGVGIDAETAQSDLTVILKLVTGSLTSINLFKVQLLFSSRVRLFPFRWGQFWNCGSSCPGCSLVIMQLAVSPGILVICKTAHRIWLRILSIALEKELKVLDDT